MVNEVSDRLAKSTSNTILPSLAQLPWTDFTPILHRYAINLWSNYWKNLPANSAIMYRTIVPNISN